MTNPGLRRFHLLAAALVGVSVFAARARAEEPIKAAEPRMLREPAQITNVVDAFDGEDNFDLNLSLGFQQTWRRGHIQRETHSTLDQLSSGGYTAGNLKVANYRETTSRLNTRADIGVYKDIALVVRLPIILSHDRKLEDFDGSSDLQSIILQGAPGEQLFRLPFESPTRSGIEYLAVGADFGLFNQARDWTKPTWIVGFEGRFTVSEPMHACRGDLRALNQGTGLGGEQQRCAYRSDVDRDGRSDESQFEESVPGGTTQTEGTNFSGGRSGPGVSRGTTALQLHTYISKRIRYIEPYGGLETLFEFQNSNSEFGSTDLKGAIVNHPPLRGSMIAGIAVIPWEVRDKFQRIELDFRAKGTYVSEGRDYSPLFDALGSSDAPSLRRPNYSSFRANDSNDPDAPGSVVDTQSEKVYFSGITDVQAYGMYTLSAQFTFQAGQYVKFNLGGAFTVEQGRILTFDQPCNPDFDGDVGRAGPCRSRRRDSGDAGEGEFSATGLPNPDYRPSINVPGRRFRLDDATAFDAWLNATVMF